MLIKVNKGTFVRKEGITHYEILQSGNTFILNAITPGETIKLKESPSYEILVALMNYIEKQNDLVISINDINKTNYINYLNDKLIEHIN